MKETIRISIWFRTESTVSPLVVCANHYIGRGWSIYQVTSCDSAWAAQAVQSMQDLDARQRLNHTTIPTAEWVVQIRLQRLRDGKSGEQETRDIRFGLSLIACPWTEHPIEIGASVDADIWARKKKRKHENRLLDELQRLFADVHASWGTITDNNGRGPSFPELLSPTRSPYVGLGTLFLAADEFNESAIRQAIGEAHIEKWPCGWLISAASVLGGQLPAYSSVEQRVWHLLREWRRRQHGA